MDDLICLLSYFSLWIWLEIRAIGVEAVVLHCCQGAGGVKIHITNLYNFNQNDTLVKKQHRVAEAGFSLGYREMGVFSFPVETDSAGELSKRLDGIIAALEAEDVVFLQLPTRNGIGYEKLLAQKCKAYRNTKLILIIHDMQLLSEANDTQKEYLSLCNMADAVVVPGKQDRERLEAEGFSAVVLMDDLQMTEADLSSDDTGYNALRQSDFYIKKALMNAVADVFASQNELAHEQYREAQDEIQIGFGLHDKTGNYSMWVGVVMQSVLEHTCAPICFHILHDDTLSDSNRDKLIQVATQNGDRIQFHNLGDAFGNSLKEKMGRYTIGSMFRVMLPELLPDVDKIIYLDADILVNRDIKELWDTDIQDYCLAAVPDYSTIHGLGIPYPVGKKEVLASHYFNTGVLVMNLNCIRADGNMREKILNYLGENPGAFLFDQDALNAVYGDRTYLLDESWNTFAHLIQYMPEKPLENRLYHFAATTLILYTMSEIDRAYYETICRTPWGTEEGRKQLYRALGRMNGRLLQLEEVIAQISDFDKKHIFYGRETNAMKHIYDMLTIREGDYRILEERDTEPNSILPCRPYSDLSEEKEAYVVFVLPEADGWTSIARLEAMGLKRERDFFEIPCLLSPDRGGYI